MPDVDAATRLQIASFEMCTRIAIRNRTLLQFAAFSTVVFTYALIGGSESSIIGVAVPYLSLCVVLLTSYHERMIYKLAEFQASLMPTDESDAPDWYSEQFYVGLQQQRVIRDWAQILMILPISLGALLLIYSRWESYAVQYRDSYLVAVIIGCLFLSVAMAILMSNMYKKGRLNFF
jgi:hypothetical protein